MDDEDGTTEGRVVFMGDEESSVLGPDGEPLRKARRNPIGFCLKPRQETNPGQSKRGNK